ncbi:MAG: hypothetical protein IJ509_00745 [Bacilli bacterium]|nr:hypothetical protein [Bacilli bacterium]
MFKKFIFSLFLFIGIIPIFVQASSNPNSLVKIGDKYYETLAEAIANVGSGETITLISDVTLDDTLLINKVVNLNLNGNDITAPTKVFQVQGGTLNITGEGTIKESEPNYGAIMIKGSSNPNDSNYSVVNVGSDVTLEGWSGIFITHDDKKSYGVNVNFSGKINAVDDTSGGNGAGIYVNGNIKDQSNAPVINIKDGAKITSTGNGLYIAGYSIYNIGASYISGNQSGIGIKSGTVNINGATIECQGEDRTPTAGYNNGINASGAAIQIESNSGYAGNINLNINSGTFKSKNSNVIYEYIGKGNDTQVDSISIKNGTFTSDANKDVIVASDPFNQKHNDFITGGKYSSDPSAYLSASYTTTLNNNLYTVTKSTMKEIDSNRDAATNTTTNFFTPITFIVIGILILIALMYFNRTKILNLFKK